MNLNQASGWFFSRSQRCLKRGLWLGGILLLLSTFALKSLGPIADTILILTIAALGVLQTWTKYRALYWFAKADEPRRMDQFRAGLGHPPSSEKCASIEQMTGLCNDPIDEHYWLSLKPLGPARMVEMVLESSFYTRSLAAQCRNLMWTIGAVGLILCTVVIVAAYQLRDIRQTSELISHIILTVFIFFLTGDFWVLGFQYNDLFEAANNSHCQAFELAKKGTVSMSEALELAMSYNSAVAQSPPLLSGFHSKSSTKQDELFKRHYGTLLGL